MRQFIYQSILDPVEHNIYSPDPSSDSGLSVKSILRCCLEARPNASLLSAVGEPMDESVSSLGSSMIVVANSLCSGREVCGVEWWFTGKKRIFTIAIFCRYNNYVFVEQLQVFHALSHASRRLYLKLGRHAFFFQLLTSHCRTNHELPTVHCIKC
jgi:hypothetical protein